MKNITNTERNGIRHPDLALPEQTNYPLGKYANLKLSFMKNHRQHDFFCGMLGIVHFLHPQERVCSFEFFGNAALFCQAGGDEFALPLRFLLGIVEVLIECTRGEKRGIGAAAVLFEIVKAHFAVFSDGGN